MNFFFDRIYFHKTGKNRRSTKQVERSSKTVERSFEWVEAPFKREEIFVNCVESFSKWKETIEMCINCKKWPKRYA